MHRLALIFVVVAVLLSIPVPAGAQAVATDRVGEQPLRPGDVIRLFVWREPTMSGDFIIDEDGSVVFARVGEYRVLDETKSSLEVKLLRDYGQYLRDPNIDVTVLRRVPIIGAVTDPGMKLVDPTITVADALALAGGPTPLGDPDNFRIIRDGVEIEIDLSIDTRVGDSVIRSGDQIFVPERSWVSRNSNVVATALSASVALVIALFLR